VAADVLARAGIASDAFPREEVTIRGFTAPRSVALIGRARDLPPLVEPPDLASPAGLTAEQWPG